MKKIILLLFGGLLLFGFHPASAQYVITPITPPPSFAFNDLWHFSVTRAAADNLTHFYISLRIYGNNSQLQVKSNTSSLTLPTGTQYYNLSNITDLQPFATSYYGAGLLQQIISSGGTFPPGVYNITYTLYGRANDGEFVPLCEESVQTSVEAMWPPMLLSPEDGDTINTIYPLLTWTPAFSSSYVGAIEYTLNLAEVLAGQNAYQAIQSNPMYFSQSALPVTTLPYPTAAQLLDTGKTYVWQVHANAGGASLGSSQVWTFTIQPPKQESEPIDSVRVFYLELESAYPSAFFMTTHKRIPFKFQNGYNQDEEKNISFTLTREGEQHPILVSETCQGCLLVTKEVYYTLNLEDNSDIKPGFYLLTVYDSKQRPQYLRILYKDHE